jgi:hypothetical protein
MCFTKNASPPNKLSMTTATQQDDDNTPLGQLYSSTMRQFQENIHVIVHDQPPPYDSTEEPPEYTPRKKSQEESTLHKFSCLIVAFDLVSCTNVGNEHIAPCS